MAKSSSLKNTFQFIENPSKYLLLSFLYFEPSPVSSQSQLEALLEVKSSLSMESSLRFLFSFLLIEMENSLQGTLNLAMGSGCMEELENWIPKRQRLLGMNW